MDESEGMIVVFLDSFVFMGSHFGLLLEKTGSHLWLSFVAMVVSMLIAIPIGLWLGHIHKGEFLAVSVSNIGRALPSLALIAILIGIVGIGFSNVLIALVLLAAPPILTNTFVAVNSVDRDITRAGRGMGLHPLQILTRVELPLALPIIFSGLRTAAVLVVSSATLATVAGGGGLGDIILNQVAYGLEGVIAGALWVAALAILTDQFFAVLLHLLTPKALRGSKREDEERARVNVAEV
ncbi:ABC transporter permease [Saxibacter everestensis]|uniref:ABC transporter permease n=1 Tax=Saxibacter everestensis TaxID=2909229 RepID=A0ABY8QRC0_9MICO|nr:ABC transporter permease [Brevibacteriaceae bacterium ZFBP1038]